MSDPDCLFCKIVSKDVPAQVVLDRDDVLVRMWPFGRSDTGAKS